MSRTDKDAPFWVRFEYVKPFHFCGRARAHQKVYTTCDLPNDPPPRSREYYSWYGRRSTMTKCHWVMSEPHDYPRRYVKNKRDWRHSLFHGPQRRAVRDAIRKAAQGDWDIEFPDGRARHSVHWDLY